MEVYPPILYQNSSRKAIDETDKKQPSTLCILRIEKFWKSCYNDIRKQEDRAKAHDRRKPERETP